MSAAADLHLLLCGVATGAQLGLALALARGTGSRGLRFATLLFLAANIAFTLNASAPARHLLWPAYDSLWLLQVGGAGWFWLFAVTLFEDRPLTPAGLAPGLVLTAVAVIARLAGPSSGSTLAATLWAAHNLVGLALAVHAVLVIRRSGAVDLVEARRRLRVPLLIVIAAYSALLSLVQLGQGLGIDWRWYGLLNAAAQAGLGLAGLTTLLTARAELFGRAEPAPADSRDGGIDAAEAHWLARLDQVMDADGLWRREGLTIGEVAEAIGLPEHRLRRLINDRLGHRNFPAFINQRRIAAGKALLADPAQAQRTIASIAFDLGFGSLGPFNRAFRDATGATPTEWRRQALAGGSPIPEKPPQN